MAGGRIPAVAKFSHLVATDRLQGRGLRDSYNIY